MAGIIFPDSEKARLLYAQRPCSVQLTGMTTSDLAATRMVVLMIRFCFAPRNSSPSSSKMGRSPRLMTFKFGTEPPSLISEISAKPFSRAVFIERNSSGFCASSKRGIMARLRKTTGWPMRTDFRVEATDGFM